MTAARTPPKVPRPEPAPRVASPAIGRLASALAAGDPGASAAFWDGATSPIIEPDGDACIVTFLWRDAAAEQVLLFVNRLTDERDLSRSLMTRLPGTDVWHLAYRMAPDWRASYTFVPKRAGERAPWLGADDHVAIRAALDHGLSDPLNPAGCVNRAGRQQSVVSLPRAPVQRWLAPRGVQRGSFSDSHLDGRLVRVYRPDEFVTGGPVVVVLDGDVWAGTQNLAVTVDNLIADGQVRAPLLLLVASADRSLRWSELSSGGGMPDWIADRLLPWAASRWPIGSDPRERVVAGQSLGGVTALLTAAERPDAVGAFVSQSASLWQPGVVQRVSRLPAGVRGYLEVGTQEWVLLEPNRALHQALLAAGVPHDYVEYNGGHDYACWRGGIADGLRSVLGAAMP